jgi:hypothetical protein
MLLVRLVRSRLVVRTMPLVRLVRSRLVVRTMPLVRLVRLRLVVAMVPILMALLAPAVHSLLGAQLLARVRLPQQEADSMELPIQADSRRLVAELLRPVMRTGSLNPALRLSR